MTVETFDSTGTSMTWTVPPGVTSVVFEVAGGNGGTLWAVPTSPALPTNGGKGAKVTATIAVTPGEALTFQIGEAGRYGAITGTNGDKYGGSPSGNPMSGLGGYPDGGSGGRTGSTGSFYAAGGGGSTRVWRGGIGGTLLICSGGGGGIGFSDGFTETATLTVNGNAGQAAPGQAGRNLDRVGTTMLNAGQGGTAVAGGSGGTGATAGSYLSGGNGATYILSPLQYSGGGGGGGYYGGGGGGRELIPPRVMGSSGGGGSSYIVGTATSVSWAANPRSSAGGNAEALYKVQSGGFVTLTYTADLTPEGWSLGLVKMLG